MAAICLYMNYLYFHQNQLKTSHYYFYFAKKMYEMHLIIHTIDELSRWIKGYCFIRSCVRSCIRWTYVFFFSSRTANNLGTGANLTYLCTPGQFFMGAISFIGTPEMQRIFVPKDKLNYTLKNCMVSMTTPST